MSFAETQQLVVQLDLKGNLASGLTSSQRALAGLESVASKTSTAAGKLGGSLNHAKGAIGSLLTGPLGILGLAGGIGGIGIAFEKVISHTNDFAFSVEKLTGLTGLSAESASTLLAVFEKFNISAERTGQIVGFAEKTLGNLSKTTTSAGKSAGDLAKAQDNVTKAHEKLRVATLKLNELEAKGKASASQLAAARYKVRDATSALAQAESTLTADRAGKQAVSTSKLIALDQEYGLHLVDSKGKLVDFETELKQVADVYTSSIDPAKKAALAAQLFGRGYADLVPLLALGSQGIADAEQAAKDLGLTLTSQNAKDLADYRKSLRETGDAIGGLELQLGLALVPAIKDMADAITSFLRNGGRDQLVGFFKDVIKGARDLAGFVTGTVVPTLQTLAGAAKTAIDAIPPWLQDLLIKGFIANKAAKFVFGFDVVGSLGDVLKKAVTGSLISSLAATGIGKAFVQNVWVMNPGFGLPKPGLPGAAAGAEAVALEGSTLLGSLAASVLPLTIGLGAAAVAAVALSDALTKKGGFGPDITHPNPNVPTFVPVVRDPGVKNPIFLGGKGSSIEIAPPIGTVAPYSGNTGFTGAMHQAAVAAQAMQDIKDASQGTAKSLANVGTVLTHALDQMHLDLVKAIHDLKNATKPKDVAAALKGVMAGIVGHQLGNVGTTKGVLGDLKTQLAHTHDPALEAALKSAIGKVERKLAGREFAAKELDAVKGILSDGKITTAETKQLKTIMADLKNRGLPKAAASIQAKIDAAKTAQVSAASKTTAAINADIQAIKDKDLSVKVSTIVTASIRDVINGASVLSRYGSVSTKQMMTR